MSLNVARLAGLAATVTGLFASQVSIGGIVLDDFAEPEKLTSGGTQQLAIHRLLGGQRQIDAMGPDERNLEFSGILRGPGAAAKGRSLDALRIAGKAVQLAWLSERRTVVVQSCELDWTRGGYRVPYRIACVVVPTPAAATSPGLLQQIGNDVSSALGIGGLAADASAVLSKVQSVLPGAAVLTGGSPAFLEISGAVGTASSVASVGASLGNSSLGTLSSTAAAQGQGMPGTDAPSASSGILGALSAATSAATYGAAGDLLSRIAGNVGRVSA